MALLEPPQWAGLEMWREWGPVEDDDFIIGTTSFQGFGAVGFETSFPPSTRISMGFYDLRGVHFGDRDIRGHFLRVGLSPRAASFRIPVPHGFHSPTFGATDLRKASLLKATEGFARGCFKKHDCAKDRPRASTSGACWMGHPNISKRSGSLFSILIMSRNGPAPMASPKDRFEIKSIRSDPLRSASTRRRGLPGRVGAHGARPVLRGLPARRESQRSKRMESESETGEVEAKRIDMAPR